MKTVRDLVKELQELDQDLPVAMSSDPEGNQFHFLSEVRAPYYVSQHDLRTEYDLEHHDKSDYGQVAILWP